MSEIELQDKIKQFLDTAILKISIKEYDNAIEKLKAAEVLDEGNPEILYNLGICYCKKELHNTAISYFDRLLALPATFVDLITVNKLLSFSLLMVGKIEEAKIHITDGLKLSRRDVTLLNMLGYLLEQEKKYDEAIDTYKEIVEIDSYNYNAYNSLAYIIAETGGDLKEAMEYAKTAHKSNPENPAYLDTIGYIHMKKGQTDLAKKYLKQALLKMPESKEIKGHINQLLKIDQSK